MPIFWLRFGPGGPLAHFDCSVVTPLRPRLELAGDRAALTLHEPYHADIDGRDMVLASLRTSLVKLYEKTGELRHLCLARKELVLHLESLLLTFGLALLLEGAFRLKFGATGQPYASPLSGGIKLPFAFLPAYRVWVIVASLVVCLTTWWFVERTRFGATLRAAHENPQLVRSFGIRVPLLLTPLLLRLTNL